MLFTLTGTYLYKYKTNSFLKSKSEIKSKSRPKNVYSCLIVSNVAYIYTQYGMAMKILIIYAMENVIKLHLL